MEHLTRTGGFQLLIVKKVSDANRRNIQRRYVLQKDAHDGGCVYRSDLSLYLRLPLEWNSSDDYPADRLSEIRGSTQLRAFRVLVRF